MTHRERTLTALNHKTPDRVPMDLGATRVTSLVAAEYEKLKRHIGIELETVIVDKIQQAVKVDEEILHVLDIDTRGVFVRGPDRSRDATLQDGRWCDEWGVIRKDYGAECIKCHTVGSNTSDVRAGSNPNQIRDH